MSAQATSNPSATPRAEARKSGTRAKEPAEGGSIAAVAATSTMMIVSAIANIVQYAQNAHLEEEKEQIKQGLTQWQASAQELESRLRDLRERHLQTHTELENTRAENVRLHAEVARLRIKIDRSREQATRTAHRQAKP